MDAPSLSTDAYEERVLAQVSTIATRHAMQKVDADTADDVAQKIVIACLLKMRAGTWREPRSLAAWLQDIVKKRLKDDKLRTKRRTEWHTEHRRRLEGLTRTWMSTEVRAEQRELAEAIWSIVNALPEMRGQVWAMIRLDHLSYDDAANILGVTRSAVSANLVRAQSQIRKYLIRRGFDLPQGFSGSGARGRCARRCAAAGGRARTEVGGQEEAPDVRAVGAL